MCVCVCSLCWRHTPPHTHTHTHPHTHLQWTTMGPASGGLQALMRRRKARKGVGCSGTPWSGQAVNWNCRTSRFSLEPLCREVRGHSVSYSSIQVQVEFLYPEVDFVCSIESTSFTHTGKDRGTYHKAEMTYRTYR